MKIARIIIMIICVSVLFSCENHENSPELCVKDAAEPCDVDAAAPEERKLSCRHTDLSEFNNSVKYPREFNLKGEVIGGVVPHHLVAAALVSGFFKAVSETDVKYDTVVIIAPNHDGETGDIVVSFCDWRAWDTIYCDKDITGGVYKKISEYYKNYENYENYEIITESDDRMEEEHSVSVLIPYINYYLPETKVSAFLLNRRLPLETVYNFTKILSDEIKISGKNVLFIGCIDFSHFLPVSQAAENDKITKAAMLDRDYRKIHGFSNGYVDSPQSLNTFLMYLENNKNNKNNLDILYNTDASEFLGVGISETTSYFIIAAYK